MGKICEDFKQYMREHRRKDINQFDSVNKHIHDLGEIVEDFLRYKAAELNRDNVIPTSTTSSSASSNVGVESEPFYVPESKNTEQPKRRYTTEEFAEIMKFLSKDD